MPGNGDGADIASSGPHHQLEGTEQGDGEETGEDEDVAALNAQLQVPTRQQAKELQEKGGPRTRSKAKQVG